MEATGTRQVILAGIGQSRLDLFLLLNEGAGYEVAGVVESDGNGESSRIAEILGVQIFRDHETQILPQADLLIYGEPKYRTLGDQLGLPPEKVWGEEQAWRILTEDGESAAGDRKEATVEATVADGETMMMSSTDLDLPPAEEETGTADFDLSSLDLPTLATEGGDKAFGLDSGTDTQDVETSETSETSGGFSGSSSLDDLHHPSEEESTVSAAYDAAPSTPPAEVTAEPVADTSAAPAAEEAAPKIDESLMKSPEALTVLEAFSTSTKSVDALYGWTLERAIALTRAYAGGVRPLEPIRLPVWHDRRSTASGEIPMFLDKDTDEKNLLRVPFGEPSDPGSAELVLVGARQPDRAGVKSLIRSILPALRTVAELEDLRREREYDGLTRRLADSLREADSPEEAIADACRELAELFDARESVLLFENTAGMEYRGFSSKGSPFFAPIGSGLFGNDSPTEKPRRFLDEAGEWHYRVPFAHDGHQGVLGLFGVRAEAGAVEAIGHQALALADSLARHFPDEVFSN